ncbi:NADH-ubiquinone oxidoreductase-F iron-sulfur binding region domain-containing protein [Halorarum halobium]|uniref:NADH-ubiquinone oxidoreductase-F iron-sulfur binding region domain-containing protein n=1 Tax=Halorarum halobium TaxID=3075121 RepID=UPI0028A7A761|nr:NADH-ubiquinone oxidoreductase-F iron-sulfur binding region domain-containing protein [Halobaculum sp. XH14]
MTLTSTAGDPVVRVSGTAQGAELRGSDADATVLAVGSTGVPAVEPLLSVTRRGRTGFHARCPPERAKTIVSTVAEAGDVTTADPDAVVEHDPDATRLPVPELPGFGVGNRSVLAACGWRRPTNPADHEAAGGFGNPDPAAVLDAGTRLRGRGWGDRCQDAFLAETWGTVRDGDGDAAVVVNGHGNPADALLLAGAPFEVLDGATALARAVDAERLVVYASAADERAVETAREAATTYPDPPAPIDVVAGPPEYRAAEPTMALEAIEGNHRLEARLRPPGPEEVGLHGRPTLVHTSRTLAQLAIALRDGREPETRVVTVTGDVAAPATVELRESDSLADAVDAVEVEGTVKAACVGGRFGGLTRDLDVGVDPEALSAANLGTDGTVHVLAEDSCVVEFVGRRARFAAEGNCGRCVPCREGTTQLTALLRAVYDGEYDADGIEELGRVMATSSLCSFGVRAGRPARTALAAFESEFAAHADGRCPAGQCVEPAEVT